MAAWYELAKEKEMGATRVNLLDPSQEPSDEQIDALMDGFLEAVRAKEAISKVTL
jgi:hypothetical protein